MNKRLGAMLIVGCLAMGGAGCASKPKKPRNEEVTRTRQEVVLPRQTGSNLDRHIVVDDESSVEETKKKSKPPPKEKVKTERTEPEQAEPKKPQKPAEPAPSTTAPDRLR